MRRPRGDNFDGFTLVELLAASALAALLVMATLSVISSVGRSEAAMKSRTSRSALGHDLVEMIRWDLGNARSFEKLENGFRLAGFGALDRATLAPTHRAVEVEYSVEAIAGRHWLMRTQRAVTGDGGAWRAPVAAGVASVALEEAKLPAGQERDEQERGQMPAELVLTIKPVDAKASSLTATVFSGRR